MSVKGMKLLLTTLAEEASKGILRPASPQAVMAEFCRAMSVRTGRPIQLVFRAFPDDIPVSGMRLDCGDYSIIVVEERAVPASQLVILGHELYHEEQGDCGHHIDGAVPAAARSLATNHHAQTLRRAAEQILVAREVPREPLLAIAARADSSDQHEVDAETFGLLFGREVRTWMTGRHAQGPVTAATLEGRIQLSLTNRQGRVI
ncbi:toxin [Streptomyces sp. NPDC040750]|uniref:toxin n=1 Tax=Streptomyces sp. NPDC040750 TaxID=3154491 RepID=UPI0033C3F6C5